jgi:hypothetical protein
MVSPDHDIGFAVLNAGPGPGFPEQIPVLTELILGTWLPAAEVAAREEAHIKFAGLYAGPNNSSITLSLRPDRPGLVISGWLLNGIDLLQVLGMGTGGTGLSAQLYPTDIGNAKAMKLPFRATLQVVRGSTPPAFAKQPQYLRPCSTAFLEIDTQRYGGLALDEFVIEIGRDGVAASLEIPVLRTQKYVRISKTRR